MTTPARRTMKQKIPEPAAPSSLRIRAEAKVKSLRRERRGPAVLGPSVDTQRLLHELQVHQVELEMQNAQLEDDRTAAEDLLEKYTDLYDSAPVGYFSVEQHGRILEVNLTGATMLGVERTRLIGRQLQHFVDPNSRSDIDQFLRDVFARVGKQVAETKLLKRGGEPFWADLHAASAISGEGLQRWCRLAVSDIAALKRATEVQRRVDSLAAANEEANREIARRRAMEASLRTSEQAQRVLLVEAQELHAQLRHLTRQVLLAQEEERKNISRQLHDEIAQVLTGISVQFATLAEAAAVKPDILRQRIENAQRMVGKSIEIIHRFARELRPAMLDDLGLIPALRSYIRDLSGRKGLSIRFSAFPGVEALDNTRRTVLYRVAQEALTNVVRHAGARAVTLRIHKVGSVVRLVVRDDGKSFPVERLLASTKHKRLGLLGMRERVEMVGGKFTVESTPGEGTTVSASVPFSDTRRSGKS